MAFAIFKRKFTKPSAKLTDTVKKPTPKTGKVVKLKPKHEAAQLYQKGKKEFAAKDFKTALKSFQELEEKHGENLFCRVVIGKTYDKLGLIKEFEDYLIRSVELEPNNPKYLGEMAAFFARKKNVGESKKFYEAALKLTPKNPKLLVQFGHLLLKNEMIEQSVEPLLKAEKLGDSSAFVHLGNAYIMMHEYRRGIEYMQKAYKKYPDNPHYLLRIADAHSGLQEHLKAAKVLEEFLELKPKDSGVRRRLNIHNQRAGIFTEQEIEIKKASENKFHETSPTLTSVQQRMVKELEEKGFSTASFDELFGDISLLTSVNTEIERFHKSNAAQDLISRISGEEDLSKDTVLGLKFKPTVVNYVELAGDIHANSPLNSLFVHERILDVANSYNACFSKLRNVNLWINPPVYGVNRDNRKGSQIWHRDQEDEKILKCFIYMTDVDETSGALEYIPYSRCTPKSKHNDVLPYPNSSGYPGDYILNKRVPMKDRIMLKLPKLSIAFVDTNGFHRGGYSTENTRIVLMATYLRPTSPHVQQNMKLDISGMNPEEYPEKIYYAVS